MEYKSKQTLSQLLTVVSCPEEKGLIMKLLSTADNKKIELREKAIVFLAEPLSL